MEIGLEWRLLGLKNSGYWYASTVESHYNGPASNGNPPKTEDILWSLEKFFFNFYIGNNRNPPITDKNGWSLEIR